MGPVAGLGQQMLGAAAHHLLAEVGERGDHIAQVELLGPPAVERQHVGAEGRLQIGVAIELVEHHLSHGVALQLDDDPHAVAVRFVPDVRDTFDTLFTNEIGNTLDQHPLVHLVGNGGDDERVAILANLLHVDLGAHDDGAAALVIGGERTRAAEDQSTGREIGAGNDLAQRIDTDLGIVEAGEAGIDHLAQIVRGDIRRHADSDAAGTVDQQVRELGRHDGRLALGAVVVLLEINRILVEVVEQELADAGEAAFGVPHRRRRVAVDRTEVALSVDQRHAHGEILSHAHQRVIDGAVAVRVILADHVADHTRRLLIGLRRLEPQLVHAEQDAPVHRLQPVAHIGQRAAHDHAHGIIEI